MYQLIYRLLSGRFGAGFEIRILMRQTARAFGIKVPKTTGFSADTLLRIYAQFTADAAMRAMRNRQNPALLHKKLYHMTYHLGSILRRWMRPKSARECFAIIQLLYRNIGITIREEKPGKFCVHQCYFSSFYTPEVCSVISAIDQGIFAGIYHGGKLVFHERITEGHDECRAGFRSGSCMHTKNKRRKRRK